MSIKDLIIEKLSPIDEELTEGEAFIAEFFREKGIKFRPQYKIENLKDDVSAEYRKADFFLPRYNMYVEFFGLWNSGETHRSRYRAKKQVYYKNEIPCIYFYPENLGIIEHAFNHRVKEELIKRRSVKELFRFRMDRFMREKGDLLVGLGFEVLILILWIWDHSDMPKTKRNAIGIAILSLLVIIQLGRILSSYRKYFKDN